ncbi:MAG TPA: porin family protein [Paludibacter sp.]|nr:porin family protein [Paludibacter sp.]
MKRLCSIVVFAVAAFLFNPVDAQEKIGSYHCPLNGENYDISISMKGNGVYSLWINAYSTDEKYPFGGVIIREKGYFEFIDNLKRARQEYIDLVKTDKANNLSQGRKVLNINSKADAYFRSSSWNFQYKLALVYNFEKVTDSLGTNYFLEISTGKFNSYTNVEQKTTGYNLIFTSVDEIDNFLNIISIEKINAYAEKTGNQSFVIKDKPLHQKPASGKPATLTFDYGVIAGSDASLGTNKTVADASIRDACTLLTENATFVNHFSAGAFARANYKGFYFQPEFLYSSGVTKYALYFQDMHNQGVNYSKTGTLKQLDIPLMIGYKLWEKNNQNLRAFAGPDLKFDLGSKESADFFSTYSTTTQNDIKTVIPPFRAAFQAGVGYDFWRISMDLRYAAEPNPFQTSVRNTVGDKDSWPIIDKGVLISSLRFSIGVKLQ